MYYKRRPRRRKKINYKIKLLTHSMRWEKVVFSLIPDEHHFKSGAEFVFSVWTKYKPSYNVCISKYAIVLPALISVCCNTWPCSLTERLEYPLSIWSALHNKFAAAGNRETHWFERVYRFTFSVTDLVNGCLFIDPWPCWHFLRHKMLGQSNKDTLNSIFSSTVK